MTTRNLEAVFKPATVALIGASPEAGSLGRVVLGNLLRAGFEGRVWPVNPKHDEIMRVRCYRAVAELPRPPDLGVVVTPPRIVPQVVTELGAAGARGAVVITAGFGEDGRKEGQALEQAMLAAAQPHLLRIVGPNCLGVMVPGIGLNASFAHMAPEPGRIAFLSQSGAIVAGVLDWAAGRDIGFSHMVSMGAMADVDFGDLLDYFGRDADVSAILIYMESVTHARKFMSAARAAARTKPVVVIKSGRHAAGAKAARSHTGAMAGADAVFDAAFRRAGILRVTTLDELFDAVETLAKCEAPAGERLAILSNGGGFGVLAADALVDAGGTMASLPPKTIEALNAVLPETWSHGNPIDIIGDAPGARYAAALEILLEDAASDAVLVLNCPTGVARSEEAARAVAEGVVLGGGKKLVLTSWVGGAAAEGGRRVLAAADVPSYNTPGDATRGFMHLVHHRAAQTALMETPPSLPEEFTPDLIAARAPIDAALAEKREWLSEVEAKALLAAYDVPVVPTEVARDAEEAAAAAQRIGEPVALKILSHDITHKSDVGGVVLGVDGPDDVRAETEALFARVRTAKPKARIEGVTVQSMIVRPRAHELILGLTDDALFGPVVLFGAGGVAVEVLDDKALALPPLNMKLAMDAIEQTRIYKQLRGYRDRPRADLDAVALTLVKISRMAADIAEIAELDINPLFADEAGVIALDARVRVRRAKRGVKPEDRLAIRPYPVALEEMVEIAGKKLMLRPVRPEDEPMFHDAFKRLSPEAVRLRFFAPLKALSHQMGAHFTQIDYDREMALVLVEPKPAGKGRGYGVARIHSEPDKARAEFAVTVTSDMAGKGLGALLMNRIIDYARDYGIGEIYGDVLAENTAMLGLARTLGFSITRAPDEPEVLRVRLPLKKAGKRQKP